MESSCAAKMFKQQSILDGFGIPNLMELTTGRWGHDHQPSEQMLKIFQMECCQHLST
jgi:hypothetical protein